MIDVGTIGHRKCEVNLNKILMELGDNDLAGSVVKLLVRYRMGLRQLKHIPDPTWRHTFANLLRKEFIDKVVFLKNSNHWPDVVFSHTCCCMNAYYRDANERVRPDTDPEPVT